MDKDLFVRKIINVDKYNEYLSTFSSNLTEIENWNKNTIYEIYNDNYKNEFNQFRFYVFKKWFDKTNNINDIDQLYSLINKNIKLLNLHSFLNANEKNYLYQIEQIIFLIHKPIKTLIVDFPLNQSEAAFFHFENCKLFHFKTNYHFYEFYITNQRIVFLNDSYICWMNLNKTKFIFLDDCVKIQYYNYSFILYYENILNLKFAIEYINYNYNK